MGHVNGWMRHPVITQWRGYEDALRLYYDFALEEWADRGFRNIELKFIELPDEIELPHWLGDQDFHESHQSNLLRKNFGYYHQYFDVPTDLPYVWPMGKI